MITVAQNNHETGSSAYWGERSDWFIAASQHRDSDCLVRSNFRSFLKLLGGESDTVAVESFNHWAVGWVEYLLINPNQPELIALANSTREDLEDYPIVDESDFSELEMEEANFIWKDCYRTKDRISYIRKHRNQFEFHDFRDLLANARGLYFSGYASELIN